MNTKDISKLILEIESTKPVRLQIKGNREDSPRPIGFYNSKKQFIPDIVARYSNKKNFYAIEKVFSEKDVHLLVFKWIIFAAEARKTGGTFFLVIPESKAAICEAIIQDKKLDIKVIKL